MSPPTDADVSSSNGCAEGKRPSAHPEDVTYRRSECEKDRGLPAEKFVSEPFSAERNW